MALARLAPTLMASSAAADTQACGRAVGHVVRLRPVTRGPPPPCSARSASRLQSLESFSSCKKQLAVFLITLSFHSCCIHFLVSQPAHIFDPSSAHPPWTLAHSSTKRGLSEVTHDDLIAKSTGFLSCLCSKPLTLPVPFGNVPRCSVHSHFPALCFSLPVCLEQSFPVAPGSLLTVTISRAVLSRFRTSKSQEGPGAWI